MLDLVRCWVQPGRRTDDPDAERSLVITAPRRFAYRIAANSAFGQIFFNDVHGYLPILDQVGDISIPFSVPASVSIHLL